MTEETRSETRVLYTAKAGESIARTGDGLIVCHPDRKPKLVHWDGSIEELDVPKDGYIEVPAGTLLPINRTIQGKIEWLEPQDPNSWETKKP